MSLILDALNRARQDDNPVPGLSTYHPVDQVSVNRKQYLLWVALSIAVVLIAWLFVERYSAPQLPNDEVQVRADIKRDAPAVSVATPEQVVSVEPEQPSTAVRASSEQEIITAVGAIQAAASAGASADPDEQKDTPARLSADVLPEEVSSQSATAVVTEAEPESEPEPEPEPESASVPAANSAVAELYRNPPKESAYRKPQPQAAARAARKDENTDASYDVNKLVQLAREEAKNTGLIESPVPLLIDLSQQIKDSIPTIYYLRHDYSSNESNSTVVLNSKTLRAGDSAAVGMKVEEILPDSVVLNYQGTQFRLRALNSWINL
ncbi:General secretion pathway protein B [Halioglobus japonicus]|nr:General secretion pathway protein B [Halioglobus japonicus]